MGFYSDEKVKLFIDDIEYIDGTLEQTTQIMDSLKDLGEIVAYKMNVEKLAERFEKIPFDQLPSVEERNQVVYLITEEYFSFVGKRPSSNVLSLLGDFILYHYIKDFSKSKFEDNVFHTKYQVKRRKRREHASEVDKLDYFNVLKSNTQPSLNKTKTWTEEGGDNATY